VGIQYAFGYADVTLGTVEEVVATSNPANTTSDTMELLFIVVIEQSADETTVTTEQYSTLRAVATDLLLVVALYTLYVGDTPSVQCVIFVVVVTYATLVHPVAARGYQLAFS